MRFWHALFVSALLMGPMAMSWSEERENSSELADTSRIDAMKSAPGRMATGAELVLAGKV